MEQGAFNKALIVGLGKTGLSCARFLTKRGFQVAVTDSRANPPGLVELHDELPNAAVFLGGFDPQVFAKAETIILSPGVSPQEPLVAEAAARGVPVFGDIEIFARYVNAPVIGITGSNGKSTVTTLVGELLKAAGYNVGVGGNLGVPVLDLLEEDEKDFYVLELSSFQLETTYSLNCAAAVILNISPDHLDRHADLAAYAQAKVRIHHGDGCVVINHDETLPIALDVLGRNVLRFGLNAQGADVQVTVREHLGEPWIVARGQLFMPVSKLKLKGRHNISNVLAALALLCALDVSLEHISSALMQFTGLPHRMQFVLEHNGITWINDSKGTNVGATVAALAGLTGKSVLIAGGQGKGADFSLLRGVVKEKARAVVLIGEDAPLIAEALGDLIPLKQVATLAAAVRQASEFAQSGDTVLLSPACASFDMFKGYDDRGNAFVKAVRALYSQLEGGK